MTLRVTRRAARRVASWALAWISAGTVVAGFLLPWAFLQPSPGAELGSVLRHLGEIGISIHQGDRTVSTTLSDLADLPRQVTGAEIPRLVRDERGQVAIALLGLFTKSARRLEEKSLAVYLVPGVATAAALLLTAAGAWPAVAAGLAAACALIAGFGWWKLSTAGTATLAVAITVGPGLWLSVWGYAGLALAGAVLAFAEGRDRS